MGPIRGRVRSGSPRSRRKPATKVQTRPRQKLATKDVGMARPDGARHTRSVKTIKQADVSKFGVLFKAGLLKICARIGEFNGAMKMMMRATPVVVRKADTMAIANQVTNRILRIEAQPKTLQIEAPVRPFEHYQVEQEQIRDILRESATFSRDSRYVQRSPENARTPPGAANPAATESTRYFEEARGFFSKVQEYRQRIGDTELDRTPPTAEQVAACRAEVLANDQEYQQFAFYLNHPNNKPYAISEKANVDFVEAGILASMVPKGQRIDSQAIFAARFIAEHIAEFEKNGSNVIVRADTFLKIMCRFGYVGRPTPSPDVPHGDGELFNTEGAAIAEIFDRLGPDATEQEISRTVEKVLGFNAGDLNTTLVLIKIAPGAIQNPRIASGNEHGANHLWLFGASTPMGHLELISDRVRMAGIPGTDPKDTAPTVQILGPRGKGIPVFPGNYLDIRDRLLAAGSLDEKGLYKGL